MADTDARAAIHELLKGTHDLARAAELLAEEKSISYWQESYTGEHVPGDFEGTGDRLRDADHMNCFEFVHLCNMLTCCEDHPRNLSFGNAEGSLLDVHAGFNEWDGKSPIPRGSVVVGTTPAYGSGSKGVYHVGISTGDGRVVSNRNGQNVTNEPVKAVFGSMFYKVYYGPYPHCACRETAEQHAHAHDSYLGSAGPLHELPTVARQNVSRVTGAVVTVVLIGLFVAAGAFKLAFGSTPPEPTPIPTLTRATSSPIASTPAGTTTAPATSAPSTGPSSQTAAAAGYRCTGGQTKLFDNWNTAAVEGGGAPVTFSTNGKPYCLVTLATYHWNNGAGALPGTIQLTSSSGTVTGHAVGTNGQDNVPDANWVVSYPPGAEPLLSGTYTCTDSDPATWAQNDGSQHLGFCRVWVTDAVKQ